MKKLTIFEKLPVYFENLIRKYFLEVYFHLNFVPLTHCTVFNCIAR